MKLFGKVLLAMSLVGAFNGAWAQVVPGGGQQGAPICDASFDNADLPDEAVFHVCFRGR